VLDGLCPLKAKLDLDPHPGVRVIVCSKPPQKGLCCPEPCCVARKGAVCVFGRRRQDVAFSARAPAGLDKSSSEGRSFLLPSERCRRREWGSGRGVVSASQPSRVARSENLWDPEWLDGATKHVRRGPILVLPELPPCKRPGILGTRREGSPRRLCRPGCSVLSSPSRADHQASWACLALRYQNKARPSKERILGDGAGDGGGLFALVWTHAGRRELRF
jgi:hypothetical protein